MKKVGHRRRPRHQNRIYDGASWKDLISYCKSFSVEDGGILKIPVATIQLANKDGKFTDPNSSDYLKYHYRVMIRVNVRDTIYDTIFYGYLYRTEGVIEGKSIPDLTLTCRGLGQKLLEETITRDYYEQKPQKTMKEVIEDFLLNPDSGYNTFIFLETDLGVITTALAQHNWERDTLQDALRDISEKINYDGYIYMDIYDAQKLYFKLIGSIVTNPYVTLNHPYIRVEPVLDIEEIKNHIFVWGDVDIGFPSDKDRFTEQDITTNWVPRSGGYLAEDTEVKKVGNKSVKIGIGSAPECGATFTVPASDSPIDASTGRLNSIFFWHRIQTTLSYMCQPHVILHDDQATPAQIEYRCTANFVGYPPQWRQSIYVPIGVGTRIDSAPPKYDDIWHYKSGSNFNWKITKAEFYRPGTESDYIWLDGLLFEGALQIDPIKYPTFFPARTDAQSISDYGRRVFHHDDRQIKSGEQASAVGDYILSVNKDIIKKFTITVKPKTWVHIGEKLTFNLPEYGIANEEWRITEIKHDWTTEKKLLRTVLTLVPKDQFVGSQAYLADTIEGIIKYR